MSLKEKEPQKSKKKWGLEDWLFHFLLALPIAIIPIASIILILLLPG